MSALVISIHKVKPALRLTNLGDRNTAERMGFELKGKAFTLRIWFPPRPHALAELAIGVSAFRLVGLIRDSLFTLEQFPR